MLLEMFFFCISFVRCTFSILKVLYEAYKREKKFDCFSGSKLFYCLVKGFEFYIKLNEANRKYNVYKMKLIQHILTKL